MGGGTRISLSEDERRRKGNLVFFLSIRKPFDTLDESRNREYESDSFRRIDKRYDSSSMYESFDRS